MDSRASYSASKSQSSCTPGSPNNESTPSPTSDRTAACAPVSRSAATAGSVTQCASCAQSAQDDDLRRQLAGGRGELAVGDVRQRLVEQVAPVGPGHVDAAVALVAAEVVVPVGAMDRESAIQVVLRIGHVGQVVIAAGILDAGAGH